MNLVQYIVVMITLSLFISVLFYMVIEKLRLKKSVIFNILLMLCIVGYMILINYFYIIN